MTVTDLEPNTVYVFKVVAVKDGKESEPLTAHATTPKVRPIPLNDNNFYLLILPLKTLAAFNGPQLYPTGWVQAQYVDSGA